jgi:hypothetical protein
MTDNVQEQTATEKKLADDYKKDFTRKPGYTYRLKTVAGQTVVTVKKIGK